jgi:hypothetical protein
MPITGITTLEIRDVIKNKAPGLSPAPGAADPLRGERLLLNG